MRSRLVLAVVGLALLALLLWSVLGRRPEDPGKAGDEPAGPPAVAGTGDASRDAEADASAAPGRETVTLGAASTPELPSWDGPPDRAHDLHGIVVGPSLERIPGAEVAVSLATNRDLSIPDLEGRSRTTPAGTVLTSADGEFRLRVVPGNIYDVDARCGDLIAQRVLNCNAGEYLEIRLAPAGALHGFVREKSTGAPLPEVRVRLYHPSGAGSVAEVLTAADGGYRFATVAPGQWGLALVPPRHESPPWTTIRVDAGQDAEQDFELAPGATIRGRVVEEGTRRPVPLAEISDNWTFLSMVRADQEGRFEARGWVLGAGWSALHARGPGFGVREFRARDLDLSQELELPLLRAGTVSGILLRSDGSAAAEAYVAVFGSVSFAGVRSSNSSVTTAGADGSFSLPGIRADIPQVLLARLGGEGQLWLQLPEPAQAGAAVNLGVLTLPQAGALSGSVIGSGGLGAASAPLELNGPDPARNDALLSLDEALGNRYLVRRQRADDLGRFHFADLAAGSYRLTVRIPSMPAHVQEFELNTGQQLTLEPIDLGGGAGIAGTVVDAAGAPIAGAIVRIQQQGEPGNLGEIAIRTDGAGAFSFSKLEDAEHLIWVDPPRDPGKDAKFLPLPERTVQAGELNLVLALQSAGVISGVVVDGPDLKAAICRVVAFSPEGEKLAQTNADSTGAFRILAPSGGSVRLEFWPLKLLPGSEAQEIRIQATREPAAVLESVPEGASGLRVALP